jgi:predicted amidohydrolase YtcJ
MILGKSMIGRFVWIGAFALAFFALAPAGAHAQTADQILFNGKILTVDKNFSIEQALAIRDGRILATGTTADMQQYACDTTQRIDLAGRTVIPGRTDMHLHGVRAALTYSMEVSWIGVPSLEEALARIKEAARKAAPGQWIIVAGGWTDIQFKEKRKPNQAEIVAAAPDNPVYIQHLYEWVLLSPPAMTENADFRRCRSAEIRQARQRRKRQADRRDRRQRRHLHHAFQQAAAAEFCAGGRRHEGLLPRAQSLGLPGSSIPQV